ncbi:uncharacterized protein si:ch211-131k2.2 isoform X2 [Triplophysa dalaica]|uniref:uncharacterized protein si:ch211-131k2.2 isoform X2 n=1 Tax=Triplophysa dalaica TaxID=1582913 RepID=UPI0024DFDEEE|nr:uncharacterized protein si:ch211-131k2.2 isoform X2 [Triplophysa dalaica]
MREGLRAGRGRQPYVYKCITTKCKNTERASEISAKPSATQRGDTEWEKTFFLFTHIFCFQMEIWKLSALMATILVCSVQSLSFTLNRENWISDWGNDPVEEELASQAAAPLKRSKSHQFYGLMGKRSGILQPVRMDRRRHKGDMFVGLMGRRSIAGPVRKTLSESSTSMDKPVVLNKESDLQEEWDKLQYYR